MLFLIYKSLVMRKHYNSKQKENHKNQKAFHTKNANSAPRIQKRRYMSKIIDLFAYLSIILLIYLTFCTFKTLQKVTVYRDFLYKL